MSVKKDTKPTSYNNSAFDDEPAERKTSGNPSPMGSNIFIVKPDDGINPRANPDPFRHDPVTHKNIGRTILRGIRCKYLIIVFFFVAYFSLTIALYYI